MARGSPRQRGESRLGRDGRDRRRPPALGIPPLARGRTASLSKKADATDRRLTASWARPGEPRAWRRWPEADRRTLIRRADFDLTGLPPSPEEVAAFIGDTAPLAYERLVDSLLASPRLWRALGPALARPCPLRRQRWLRERPRPQDGLSLPRLRHPRPQRGHAVRPVREAANRRATSSSPTTRRPSSPRASARPPRARRRRRPIPTRTSRRFTSTSWTTSSPRPARACWG